MLSTRHFLPLIAALALTACGSPDESAPVEEAADVAIDNAATGADILARAEALVQSNILVDGHIDVPFRMNRAFIDTSVATDGGDFDFPRAKAGGLNAPFMSIYTPASTEFDGTANELAQRLIGLVEQMVETAPDKFAIAYSVADVRAQFDAGLVSLPMGMENGAPIAGDLANVQHFHDRGIRYITLTHSKSGHIADSSYDEERRWGGLSPFGEELVAEMNRVGIMVDISHVSDEAFWDVMELTDVPAIASHSSLRHFTPGWERNMADDMVTRLGEEGGVIMINFGSAFLTREANEWSQATGKAFEAYAEANDLDPEDFRARFEWEPGYRVEHPYPYATISDVADHIDRVVELAGVDHVGIGSDYDGVGDSLPPGMKDVAGFPNLIAELIRRGYSDEDIAKILGGNLLRVWSAVEAYAAASTSDSEE